MKVVTSSLLQRYHGCPAISTAPRRSQRSEERLSDGIHPRRHTTSSSYARSARRDRSDPPFRRGWEWTGAAAAVMGGKCTTEGAGTTRGLREAAAVREAAGETAAAEAAAQAAEEAAAAVGGATGMIEGRGELRFPFSSPPPPPFYRLARDSITLVK